MTLADIATSPDLPMELRSAVDIAVDQTMTGEGVLPAHVMGSDRLVAEFSLYGASHSGTDWLVLLGADESLVRSAIAEHRPPHVVSVVLGPLGKLPIGRTDGLREDMSREAWREMGYSVARSVGIKGPGWYGWAAAERICRLAKRPDLADRCRIGTLRTLVSLGNRPMSTVVVRRYQRG